MIKKIAHHRYPAIAICFVHSYANPGHEYKVAQMIYQSYQELFEDQQVHISVSSKVLPQFREFERASTTVLNAYVQPKMTKYLGELEHNLLDWSHTLGQGNIRFQMMRSDGGQFAPEKARNYPYHTILSGPAGGVLGARALAKNAGYSKLITFDMGGTSTDVALIPDEIQKRYHGHIDGLPLHMPAIDIHTVGAGGGSIVQLDQAGALCVGPESAGADPGPVCYGQGKQLTLTDIHLFLGRIIPNQFLGGQLMLNTQRVRTYLQKLAHKMDQDPHDVAEMVLEIAESTMEQAIRVMSVERGYDPSEFTLVSFGGAGGLHAVQLAQKLQIPKVFIPPNPGGLSAYGMLFADIQESASKTVMLPARHETVQSLQQHANSLVEICQGAIRDEGIDAGDMHCKVFLDMRYIGQSYEITVPLNEAFTEHFHRLHQIQFGHADSELDCEIVNIRVEAIGTKKKPQILTSKENLIHDKPIHDQKVNLFFQWQAFDAPVYPRNELAPGQTCEGPCIITEYSATTFVPPRSYGRIDDWYNLIIDVPEGRPHGI